MVVVVVVDVAERLCPSCLLARGVMIEPRQPAGYLGILPGQVNISMFEMNPMVRTSVRNIITISTDSSLGGITIRDGSNWLSLGLTEKSTHLRIRSIREDTVSDQLTTRPIIMVRCSENGTSQLGF